MRVEGNNANIPFEREMVAHSHSGTRHRVRHYYGCYNALRYPILFANEEIDWHQNIPKIDPNASIKHDNSISNFPTSTSPNDVFANEELGISPIPKHIAFLYCSMIY